MSSVLYSCGSHLTPASVAFPGLGDRDNRPFGPRGGPGGPVGPGGLPPHGRGGPHDDFPEPPRSLLSGRFERPDDFDRKPPGPRDVDFDLRGPPRGEPMPPDVGPGPGGRGGPDGPPGLPRDFDRPPRGGGGGFDFEMRQRNPDGPPLPPFDHPGGPRGPPMGPPDDCFDMMRDHPDFDHRGGGRRGDPFFMDSKFGHPGMRGPRGGPHQGGPPGMMGAPDGFGPRGGRGHGEWASITGSLEFGGMIHESACMIFFYKSGYICHG